MYFRIRSEKCTIFLNETSEHTNFSSNRSHPRGQLEKMHYVPYKLTNTSIHKTIVPKKGPKPYLFEQFRDESKEDEDFEYVTQEPTIAIETDNADIVQTEWILSDTKHGNENKEPTVPKSFKSELTIGSITSEEYSKIVDDNEQLWKRTDLRKTKSLDADHTTDTPRFTGYESYIKIMDPLILKR